MNRRSPRLLLASLALLLAGCLESQMTVRLEPDGSGTRSVEFHLDSRALEAANLDLEQARGLCALGEANGWALQTFTRSEGGEEFLDYVLSRTLEIASLDGWGDATRDLKIEAALEDGNVLEARAENHIEVERGGGAGFTSLAYRERFALPGILELLDAFMARSFANRVADGHPGLDPAVRAELRGLMAGILTLTKDRYHDDRMEESERQRMQEAAMTGARRILQGAGIPPRQEVLDDLLADFPDEAFDAYLENEVPGIFLAALLTVKVEVHMPGEIVETNADRHGTGFAAWEFQLWDALEEPRELFVRTKMPD